MTLASTVIQANRRGFIGGSDAQRIMKGDWINLYREKVGDAEPEDLSGVFRVQLGLHTENFHAAWFTKTMGYTHQHEMHLRHHKEHPWMCANLDRWLPDLDTFLEMKHSANGVNVSDKARYYMAQLQHYMAVTGVTYCYFSVIRGNDEPQVVIVDRDETYIEELIKMEKAFWWHVENKMEPDIIPIHQLGRAEKMVESIKVDAMRVADMTTNNHWSDLAAKIIANADAAKIYDDAKDELRKLVEDDVAEAYGHGITAKRDKRGRITIRLTKEA